MAHYDGMREAHENAQAMREPAAADRTDAPAAREGAHDGEIRSARREIEDHRRDITVLQKDIARRLGTIAAWEQRIAAWGGDPAPAAPALGVETLRAVFKRLGLAHNRLTDEEAREIIAALAVPDPTHAEAAAPRGIPGRALGGDLKATAWEYLEALDARADFDEAPRPTGHELCDYLNEVERLQGIIVQRRIALEAALAAQGEAGDGWQSIETAPYGVEVEIRAGMMRFRAELVRDGSMDEDEKPCDQWRATREGEHPQCWSDGSCWESNADLSPSLQPDGWRSVSPAPRTGREA